MIGISISFIGILVIGAIVVVALMGGAQVLQTLTERQRHHEAPMSDGRRRPGPGAAIGIAGLVGVGLVMMLTLTSYQTLETRPGEEQLGDATSYGETMETRVEVLPTYAEEDGDPAGVVSVRQEDVSAKASLPEWTRHSEIVLEEGMVGRTHFVAASAACDSEEEARQEAISIASENLLKRLKDAHPELKSAPIPADVFAAHAQKDSFTESWKEQFGGFEEPMYRVYLKYEDSAQTRQPIVEMWQRSVVDKRVVEYGAGFGIAALGLGMVSAFLRIFLAAPGRRTGPVVTTTALAAAAGALALLA